jgi:hypothetical protein
MIQDCIRIIQQIDLDFFKVILYSDGIIIVKITNREEIGVDQVKQVIDVVGQIGEQKKYPLMVVVNEFVLPTPEAREYLATPESNPYGTAAAYVIGSFAQKLVGNFYLSYNKPARPTRIFNSEEKALEWLRTFL